MLGESLIEGTEDVMESNKQGERISQKPVQAYDSAYQNDSARALNVYRYFMPVNAIPEGEAPPANAQPAVSTTTESEQNFNNSRASSMPDSLKDKRVDHEGTSGIKTSATSPGLSHRLSERSQGTNTVDGDPALTRENPAVAIPFNNDNNDNNDVNKAKRAKKVAKRVCTECGTLDTPQWRIGPNGRNTLCNACGRMWSFCFHSP